MKWAMLVLFLLILGLGAFVVFGTAKTPEPEPAVAAAEPDIDLRIDTDPAGAEVLTPGGEVLGTTPLRRSYPAESKGSEMVLLLRLEGYEEKRVRVRLGGSEEPMQVALKVRPAKPVVKEDEGDGDNKPTVSRSRSRRRWRPTRTSELEPQGEDPADSTEEPTEVVKTEPVKKPAPKPVVVDEGSGSGLVVDDDPVNTVDSSDGLIVE